MSEDCLEVLERLADKLREARSSFEYTSIDGAAVYYSVMNTVATCIENVLMEHRHKKVMDDVG